MQLVTVFLTSYVSIGLLTSWGAVKVRYRRVDSWLTAEIVRPAVEYQSKYQQHRKRASLCLSLSSLHQHPVSSPPTLQMFEKFSISDVDSSGRGGEYTVQAGFGWTNGVVLWLANTFGEQLVGPVCPDPLFATGGTGSTGISGGEGSTRKKSGSLQLKVALRQLFGLWLVVASLQFLFT